ncbi:AAA family ATPase [Acanthopleuribacter pedis]
MTPLEGMSDGFRGTFVWLFDLLVRAAQKGIAHLHDIHAVVFIDEIDLHLHPTWQRTLLPVLEQEFKNVQFLVTTHSPFVVQSWQNENVFLLKADGSQVTVSRMEGEGRPFGHEIEAIINHALALESHIPSVSHRLFNMLINFDQAVEQKNKEQVQHWYREIHEVIPSDSGYRQYLDIMSTEFREDDA